MAHSKPIQILIDEHTVISAVLGAVEAMAKREAQPFPRDFFEKAFDFFATFADKCHHAKEESHLFPAFEARGLPAEGGPTAHMRTEHEQGRAHVRAVREALPRAAGDADARQTVSREALAYVALLRQHIFKENNVLFPMGDGLLTEQDRQELLRTFQCAEHQAVPPGTHERYTRLADELCAAAGVPRPSEAAETT